MRQWPGLIPTLDPPNSITNESGDSISLSNDYLMLSDIFLTGWTSLNYARFLAGGSVAVFGAGPVGLMSACAAGRSRLRTGPQEPHRAVRRRYP
jgi:threonine dehydrogenase-like Zn-dependent dehydrogenase